MYVCDSVCVCVCVYNSIFTAGGLGWSEFYHSSLTGCSITVYPEYLLSLCTWVKGPADPSGGVCV